MASAAFPSMIKSVTVAKKIQIQKHPNEKLRIDLNPNIEKIIEKLNSEYPHCVPLDYTHISYKFWCNALLLSSIFSNVAGN